MNKKDIKYWLILLGVIILVFVGEYYAPKTINWDTITYGAKDKNPYGSYVVYNMLEDIFPNQKISAERKSFYDLRNTDLKKKNNYIVIDQYFEPDSLESHSLLALVNEGGNAFIAAEDFFGKLADTLKIKTDRNVDIKKKEMGLKLVNPLLKNSKFFNFNKSFLYTFFASIDTAKTTVLGINDQKDITFIKVPFGKGNFFLSTTPIPYTNYNIIDSLNFQYISQTLSYLPNTDVIWSEYYKVNIPATESQSPLRFFLNQPSLRWALYIVLFSILLFIFFEAKRKQRIIPIIKPLSNTTLEFTETLGRLYFQYKDHKNIADKKITYFLEYIRTRYYLKTENLDSIFLENLNKKSGVSLEKIETLFKHINFIQRQTTISESDLLELNRKMEEFNRISV